MSKSKSITAAELMEQLQNDPDYQAKIRQQHEAQLDANSQYETQVAPLHRELGHLGLVADLYELVQKYGPLSDEVIQLLLHWLLKSDNNKVLEGIVRALGAPQAPYNGTNLVMIFEKTESQMLRWVIANTIAEARPTHINDWLTSAVQETKYGKAREMLIVAVARMVEKEVAITILKQCANDFPGYVAKAFSECGNRSHIDFLNGLKSGSNSWERQEIENAVHTLRNK